MNRYVIEIEEKPLCVFDKDTQTYFPRLWRVKGFNSLMLDEEELSRLEELNSDYINEHYGELQDTAYKKGLHDGESKCRYCNDYQRGLDDAWEAARKIVTWPDRSLVNSDTFDLDPGENIFTKYSASRAIEKLKAFEEKQKADDEIKVGDVVAINHTDRKGIATRVDRHGANVLQEDGQTGYYLFELLKKTDKHDSSIEAILKRISYENN